MTERFSAWDPLADPAWGTADMAVWRPLLESDSQRDAIFQVPFVSQMLLKPTVMQYAVSYQILCLHSLLSHVNLFFLVHFGVASEHGMGRSATMPCSAILPVGYRQYGSITCSCLLRQSCCMQLPFMTLACGPLGIKSTHKANRLSSPLSKARRGSSPTERLPAGHGQQRTRVRAAGARRCCC